MKKFTSYKVAELIEMAKEFTFQADNLNRQLEQIYSVKEEIEKIINKYNKEYDLQTSVLIPDDFLEVVKMKKRALHTIINWKTLIVDTITEYDTFFTTERLYLINRIKYPNEFSDKEKVIRNISSALRYLFLEHKINKYKDDKGKYNYGLVNKHFDTNGNPVKDFVK